MAARTLKQPPPTPSDTFRHSAPYTTIRSLMQFDGPAPELINGRAAMLGFAAALIQELHTGKGVLAQLEASPRSVVVAFTLILVGSLFPLGQNVTPEKRAHGIFQAKAELWGGRLACASPLGSISIGQNVLGIFSG
jgi:hypothetical protein